MPFQSPQQEIWMKLNLPSLYKDWVKKYGHAKGYKKRVSQNARKRKKRRNRRSRPK